MILIVDEKRHTLCNDGRFRDVAWFGNMRGCAKTFSRIGNAKLRAQQMGGVVAVIPDGLTVEAGLNIFEEDIPCPDKPGFVMNKKHGIEEFILK